MSDNGNFHTLQVGHGSNYLRISEYGELRLSGKAKVYDDMKVPVNAFNQGAANAPNFIKILDNGAGSAGLYTYAFDAAAEEELFFAVQLPHTWAEETPISAHVHWSPVSSSASVSVCWGLEYSMQDINGVFGNSTIIYGDEVSSGATDLVADTHYLTSLGEIVTTGLNISAMLIGRLFRDATGAGGTDDYAGDAGLLELDFHYQIDSLGSEELYIKA